MISTLKVEVVPTLVDYDVSLEDLIEAAKLTWVDQDITSKNFSTERTGKRKVNIHILSAADSSIHRVEMEEVRRLFRDKKLREGELFEALAFFAHCQMLRGTLLVPGSSWVDAIGRKRGVVLSTFPGTKTETERQLTLSWSAFSVCDKPKEIRKTYGGWTNDLFWCSPSRIIIAVPYTEDGHSL